MLMLMPDIYALIVAAMTVDSDPTMWPVTIAGWISLFLAIAACAGVGVGWGKMLSKAEKITETLAKLDGKMENLSTTVETLSKELTEVEHTLWGPRDGDGIAADMRDIKRRVEQIERRNTGIDAMTERERGASEAGQERRYQHRRREDRIALGEELPDKK